jgi:hypothetical protein
MGETLYYLNPGGVKAVCETMVSACEIGVFFRLAQYGRTAEWHPLSARSGGEAAARDVGKRDRALRALRSCRSVLIG